MGMFLKKGQFRLDISVIIVKNVGVMSSRAAKRNGCRQREEAESGEVKEENGGTEHIDKELVLSIEKLQEIQDELEKLKLDNKFFLFPVFQINEEASEKVLEVEQKYNTIRKPVYDKRNDIIKTIPDFWLTAFMSHPALSELLTEEDQKIFKYLSNLEVKDCEDVKSGYSIAFGISNGVAEEKKGNKRSHAEERTAAYMDQLSSSIFTILFLSWKIDFKFITCRYHVTLKPSFFSWFSDTQHSGDIDEIQDEVAEIIKDDLWPNPLTYFNNEADEEEFEMVDDDDEDKDSDGSEDDDDQDDEDDDGEED
ncbi:NAP1-related protein 2 [Sesamum angolense]|uniref:NAP1-related protein 2 n=1 Tax=Sesamum angolense TaxID=2727404 RepID=A0AAE1WZF5_9LAMI|nr:NAP1-related protein 2 [Sesamum angolense]